jgi:flagellar motor switch protein FliN/FliY
MTDADTLLPDLAAPDEPALEFAPKSGAGPVAGLCDVPVRISAVLGKKRMTVAALMRLEQGAIIELDRKVGEPIDLYVNDRLIARGELVMVEGSLGVTMTEIVKDDDR